VHCGRVVTEPVRDCRHSVLMFQVIARAVGWLILQDVNCFSEPCVCKRLIECACAQAKEADFCIVTQSLILFATCCAKLSTSLHPTSTTITRKPHDMT